MLVAAPLPVDTRMLAEILPRIEGAVLRAADPDLTDSLEGDADGDA